MTYRLSPYGGKRILVAAGPALYVPWMGSVGRRRLRNRLWDLRDKATQGPGWFLNEVLQRTWSFIVGVEGCLRAF